jgi:hypothetical protein
VREAGNPRKESAVRIPLRVLIVEDLPEQAEIVAHELTERLLDSQPAVHLETSVASAIASVDQIAADPPAGAPEDTGPEMILLVLDEDPLRLVICETLEEAPDPLESG